MDWLSRQFSTRVIVLMPVAIAINIVLGYTVQTVLKLPIYLDSIGTILVGVLAGPIAGRAHRASCRTSSGSTRPGIGGGTIGPFAVVAGVIGLLAGLWGYLGVYKSRPASGLSLVIAAVIAALIVIVLVVPIVNNPAYTDPDIGGYPSWVFTAAVVIAVVVAIVVAGFIYLRRDLAGFWVAIAGVVTGIVAAFISAPISAYRLRRRDGQRHGPDRRRAAAGRLGRPQRVAGPGPLQRPDRQDHHELRRLHHPRRPVAPADRAVPARRANRPQDRTSSATGTSLIPTVSQTAGRPGAGVPEYVTRVPRGTYVGLNPTTKLVLAFGEAAIAFLVRGWTGPLVVLVIVALTAASAGVSRRMLPFVLATIPLVVSILLVNTFLFPGRPMCSSAWGP